MNKDGLTLEEKDLYKLFNEIEIDESEFDDESEKVSTIEKERMKKKLHKKINNNKRKSILKYGSVAAAISLVCLIGVGKAAPSFAKDVPILNSIIQALNANMGVYEENSKYSEVINKSIEDNGVTFTLNDIIADDSKIILSYTIKSDKKVKDLESFGLGRFLEINDQYFASTGGSVGQYIDDYTYVGKEELSISPFQIPKKCKINLDINQIGDVNGKWNLAFTTSKDEIYKESVTFKPNTKVDFPQSTVNVNKVTFSPMGTYISVNGNYKDESVKKPFDVGVFDYFYWMIYDDNGEQIVSRSIGGGTIDMNKPTFQSQMEYNRVNHIPKYLTVVPCKVNPYKGSVMGSYKDGKEVTKVNKEGYEFKEVSSIIDGAYPKELSQGKIGKIVVNNIKVEDDKTIVNFTAKGKAPYLQSSEVYIKDQRGERVSVKMPLAAMNPEKPNEYTIVYEALKPNEKYSICTSDLSNVEVREDLKFKIELNK